MANGEDVNGRYAGGVIPLRTAEDYAAIVAISIVGRHLLRPAGGWLHERWICSVGLTLIF